MHVFCVSLYMLEATEYRNCKLFKKFNKITSTADAFPFKISLYACHVSIFFLCGFNRYQAVISFKKQTLRELEYTALQQTYAFIVCMLL